MLWPVMNKGKTEEKNKLLEIISDKKNVGKLVDRNHIYL